MVEQDEGGGGDGADAPGAEADPAQRLEAGLEQGVAAFGGGPDHGVQQVDAALVRGQPALGGVLDRGGQRVAFAFVTQVGQRGVLGVGPLGQGRQCLGVGTQGGGVVLAAGPDVGGPDRPAVGRGDDLRSGSAAARCSGDVDSWADVQECRFSA